MKCPKRGGETIPTVTGGVGGAPSIQRQSSKNNKKNQWPLKGVRCDTYRIECRFWSVLVLKRETLDVVFCVTLLAGWLNGFLCWPLSNNSSWATSSFNTTNRVFIFVVVVLGRIYTRKSVFKKCLRLHIHTLSPVASGERCFSSSAAGCAASYKQRHTMEKRNFFIRTKLMNDYYKEAKLSFVYLT